MNMVNETVQREIEKIIDEHQAKKLALEEKSASIEPKKPKNILRFPIGSEEKVSTDTSEPYRNYYLPLDEKRKDFLLIINETLLNEANREAFKKQLSLSSYIRECLIHRLHKTSPKNAMNIDALLKDCTKIENGQRTFSIEGEEGFLAEIKKRGLTGSVWTFSQLDKVAFILGRQHGRSTQEKCVEAMNLDKVQTQYFRVSMFVAFEMETAETFDMPYAICLNCLRPLTKEQYAMSGCQYCGGTKGREFLYDEKVLFETLSNPYAMCSNPECRRPLPKESLKWKCCPYCQTKEQQIILNYEGILEKTSVSEEQTELVSEESETEAKEIETPQEVESSETED